jgi:hypothetical protein
MQWPPANYHPDRGSGYQLRLKDLRQLVSDAAYQSAIAVMLKDWFGYDIVGTGKDAAILAPGGDIVELETLHDLIQSDPKKQYYLYQRAMSFWR